MLLFGLCIASAPMASARTGADQMAVPAYSSFDPIDNGDAVQVRTLSSRADLVSGGDAFVEIVVPAGSDLTAVVVDVDGVDVSSSFVAAGPGLRGLVRVLPVGSSVITATLSDGSGARLDVVNAAQGGPVFSGPLIEPWTCTNGSEEPDCSQDPTVNFYYRST
ncbi:MAG TPA: DUF6351 family protein, partial [Acidimicrobiales bacterium]|nr:DUF6351 family protein [Acidimicrobiales bacterium]